MDVKQQRMQCYHADHLLTHRRDDVVKDPRDDSFQEVSEGFENVVQRRTYRDGNANDRKEPHGVGEGEEPSDARHNAHA